MIFCADIQRKVQAMLTGAENFQLHKCHLCYALGMRRDVGVSSRLV